MAGKKYVLLVDNNNLFSKAFRDHFLKRNPQVEMGLAENAKAALKHLGFHPCDLLIADLRLPEVDGLQLFLRVRRSYPHLTKVMMASHASPRDSQKAQDYGSVSYIEKPATPPDYDKAVSQIAEILAKTPEVPRGSLANLKLDEMIAGCDEPPKSCVLAVYVAAGSGLLYLSDGRIVHAQTPYSRGSNALEEMFGWQAGIFEKRDFQEPPKRTLDFPWEDVFALWMEPENVASASSLETKSTGAREPIATAQSVKPAPVADKHGGFPPPQSMPRRLTKSDPIASTAVQPTARIKPVPAAAAPLRSDVALNEKFIVSTGLQFALEIDGKGTVRQEIRCPDLKLFVGIATFTSAKVKEVAKQFQWEPPRSIHFVHESTELAALPFADKTVLLGWASGQDPTIEKINQVFGVSLLDRASVTKPRLPATIDAMKKIPGLNGYAIFNKDHQILVKKFSAQWNFGLLQSTARVTAQICMVLQLQKLPVKLAQIKFDPGSIFAIPCEDLMLITICHHEAKVPLLKDCLSRITANEIKKAVL